MKSRKGNHLENVYVKDLNNDCDRGIRYLERSKPADYQENIKLINKIRNNVSFLLIALIESRDALIESKDTNKNQKISNINNILTNVSNYYHDEFEYLHGKDSKDGVWSEVALRRVYTATCMHIKGQAYSYLQDIATSAKTLTNAAALCFVLEPARVIFDKLSVAKRYDEISSLNNILCKTILAVINPSPETKKEFDKAVHEGERKSETIRRYASNFMLFGSAILAAAGIAIGIASLITPPGWLAWAALGTVVSMYALFGSGGALLIGGGLKKSFNSSTTGRFLMFSEYINPKYAKPPEEKSAKTPPQAGAQPTPSYARSHKGR